MKHVLIVDDDRDAPDCLELVLGESYRLRLVDNGMDALDELDIGTFEAEGRSSLSNGRQIS